MRSVYCFRNDHFNVANFPVDTLMTPPSVQGNRQGNHSDSRARGQAVWRWSMASCDKERVPRGRYRIRKNACSACSVGALDSKRGRL